MKPTPVKIKYIQPVTHDVIRIVTEKPPHFDFTPGQAADISINKQGWKDEKRPFTFTSLPQVNYLEFTIKTYPSHNGVTNQLLQLKSGDEIIIHEVFGDIVYKGEGIFIAGGAGVTPFICIFRDLMAKHAIGNNKLIFANKTRDDIILVHEFTKILDHNFINILSDDHTGTYLHGLITEDLIKASIDHSTKYFYVCGPPPMMDSVEKQLSNLKISEDFIIKEGF